MFKLSWLFGLPQSPLLMKDLSISYLVDLHPSLGRKREEVESFLDFLLNQFLSVLLILLSQSFDSLFACNRIKVLLSILYLGVKWYLLKINSGNISHLQKINVIFESISISQLNALSHLLSPLMNNSPYISIYLSQSCSLSELRVPCFAWVRRLRHWPFCWFEHLVKVHTCKESHLLIIVTQFMFQRTIKWSRQSLQQIICHLRVISTMVTRPRLIHRFLRNEIDGLMAWLR